MGESIFWILLVILLPALLLGTVAPLQEQMELDTRQRDLELMQDIAALERGERPWGDWIYRVMYFEEYWVCSTGESPGIPRYFVEVLDGEPVYFSRTDPGAWIYREGVRVPLENVDPQLRKKALESLRKVAGREGSWNRGVLLAFPRRRQPGTFLLEKRL